MELPFIGMGKTMGEANRVDRSGDLFFGHVRIEMSIGHPSEDVEQEVGYMRLDSAERSRLETNI